MKNLKQLTVIILKLLLLSVTGVVAAEDVKIVKAVGTWEYFTNYQKHEGPFWNQHISAVSNGSIVGEITPHTDLGLRGDEIMRLVKKGVFDFAFGMSGYVTPESAIFEGADLSSLVQNIDDQKRVANAYFPTLERAFAEKYNAKLMLLYPFPSQMIWCNQPVNRIEDLKDKRIRVYLTTLGDFVEGVGAVPVSIPFGDVPNALKQGIVDCVITGTMSAYTGKLYKIANHGFTLRVGWGLAFGAMNLNKWQKLSPNQQQLLLREVSTLSNTMWEETAREDAVALSCLSEGPCHLGEVGQMSLSEPTSEDLKQRKRIAKETILPRWAERCGPECTANWNRTVGKVIGLRAEITP